MIKPGDVVRDKVTGFTGTVVSITTHLAGATEFRVQPMVDDDTDMRAACYFNEGRMERVDTPTTNSIRGFSEGRA